MMKFNYRPSGWGKSVERFFIFPFLLLFTLSACSTLVQDKNSVVTFQGPADEEVIVKTPYGSTKLVHGSATLVIPHRRDDIPIQIICNQNPPVSATLPTTYAKGTGIWGNAGLLLLLIIPGVVGYVVDLAGNVAYVPESPLNVTQYCSQPPPLVLQPAAL